MPKPRLPYLEPRHRKSKVVWYVRLSRHAPRVLLHGDYGSEQFMAEYRAAIAGSPAPREAAHKGSFRWLVDRWCHSSDFRLKSVATQRQRENILHNIVANNGALPFAKIRTADISEGRERRMATPFAANNYLKTMKALFKWAVSVNLLTDDPAAAVAFLPAKTAGHEPWTDVDVLAYRERWPLGTRPRVAFEVIYASGLRRGDAVMLGKQHVGRDGICRVTMEKTGRVAVFVMTDSLKSAIEAGPVGDLIFITNASGEPMPKESFGNQFREWCNAAGVKKSAHGIRKLAATETAEGGGSELALQAMFGWNGQEQSLTYTRNAGKAGLARQAAEARKRNKPIPPDFKDAPPHGFQRKK